MAPTHRRLGSGEVVELESRTLQEAGIRAVGVWGWGTPGRGVGDLAGASGSGGGNASGVPEARHWGPFLPPSAVLSPPC